MNSACVAAQLRCSNQFLLLLLPFLPPFHSFFRLLANQLSSISPPILLPPLSYLFLSQLYSFHCHLLLLLYLFCSTLSSSLQKSSPSSLIPPFPILHSLATVSTALPFPCLCHHIANLLIVYLSSAFHFYPLLQCQPFLSPSFLLKSVKIFFSKNQCKSATHK